MMSPIERIRQARLAVIRKAELDQLNANKVPDHGLEGPYSLKPPAEVSDVLEQCINDYKYFPTYIRAISDYDNGKVKAVKILSRGRSLLLMLQDCTFGETTVDENYQVKNEAEILPIDLEHIRVIFGSSAQAMAHIDTVLTSRNKYIDDAHYAAFRNDPTKYGVIARLERGDE